MTSEKPEWFELSEGDEGAPVLRKKSKKLPFIAVAAAGAIVIGGALFANANDEPNASASTSSMAVPSDPGADNSTASSANGGAPTITNAPQGSSGAFGHDGDHRDGFRPDGDHRDGFRPDGDHRDGERHDD